MSKYTFVTIVAPPEVRANFTYLRDSLGSSDKQLMQAFWNICTRDVEAIGAEVQLLRLQAMSEKMEKREMKMAAKTVNVEAKVIDNY